MDRYLDLLRNIVKYFNNNEFDYTIKIILNKLFNNYYVNRKKYVYCIDNLYQKYDISKYNFIKKKYKLSNETDLIFRFNRYNKKSYIIKSLKENDNVILNKNETYESVADNILQNKNINNYKKYIEDMFIERNYEQDDFQIILNKRVCYFMPCLNKIVGSNNYCHLHNENSV